MTKTEEAPKTELRKLLEVIVREIGNLRPIAFKDVDVEEALRQADGVECE